MQQNGQSVMHRATSKCAHLSAYADDVISQKRPHAGYANYFSNKRKCTATTDNMMKGHDSQLDQCIGSMLWQMTQNRHDQTDQGGTALQPQ